MERYSNAILKFITMATCINQIDDRTIKVNHKIVYKDTNDKWIARKELTTQEHKRLASFLQKINEPLYN